MEAEQVNQDGAQDALDAGQQNTSHDARRETPVTEGAPQTAAPEPSGEAPAGLPGETPAAPSGEVPADLPGEVVPEPSGEVTTGLPGEIPAGLPGEPPAEPSGEVVPEPSGGSAGETPGDALDEPAPGEPATAGATAAGEASGADTLDVAPGTAVPGDETPGAVAQEAAAPQHPAPDTPGGEDAAEALEPAGQAEDLGEAGGNAAEASADPDADADEDGGEDPLSTLSAAVTATSIMFHAPDLDELREAAQQRAARRKEARRRHQEEEASAEDQGDGLDEETAEAREEGEGEPGPGITSRRRRRRRRGEVDMELVGGSDDDPPNTVTRVRAPRVAESATSDQVVAVRGSTRLEAKKQRRRESRQSGRRRQVITEAEFLARRESVERQMLVRQKENRIQIGVLEDGVLAEHFVSHTQQDSLIGNVYVGKVQNVLPSMEAAFIDIGRGRNAVLYAGEVNWDASNLDGGPRRIENALKSGDSVLVQVTKDPVGHKGARLTSQISLPGRYLVYVPGGSMTGISRKLPDVERARLKKILKDRLPDGAGVIVRTAAEGASEQELTNDINRLRAQWEQIQERAGSTKTLPPEMLYAEPDLTIKTVRDVFNEDFTTMVVQGDEAWDNIEAYVTYVAPDLLDRLSKWEEDEDLFVNYRVEEQIQKALERKVYLPSGGSLVIDRTEAMTVVDVNTGKFTGSGGNLEETVTKNNLEAAEEIVRQLRLRDIGGIIVIDFIDMVLESNRDLVLRRMVECLGRDRTKHQVAEVTSLGLVQMTRKRMGTGLLEVFSEPCEHCAGRGVVVHDHPLEGRSGGSTGESRDNRPNRTERKRSRRGEKPQEQAARTEQPAAEPDAAEKAKAEAARTAFATIAAATHHEAEEEQRRAEEAAQAEARPEGSGRSRKKRRGKRSRGRGQGTEVVAEPRAEEEPGAQAETREEPARTDRPSVPAAEAETGSRLTIKGEVIELPQGHVPVEEPAPAPSLSLDSLAEAFERMTPEQKVAEQKAVERKASEQRAAERRPAAEQAPRRKAPAARPEAEPETAQPAAQKAAETAAVQPEQQPEPARPRRRSRRASAPAAKPGEGEVTAGEAAAAEGARHVATLSAPRPAEREGAGAAPTIVGVGVKAQDLTSGKPSGQG